MEEWRVVFWITSFLYFIGCIFYLIFTQVDLQPWAVIRDTDDQKNQANLNKIVETNEKILIKSK